MNYHHHSVQIVQLRDSRQRSMPLPFSGTTKKLLRSFHQVSRQLDLASLAFGKHALRLGNDIDGPAHIISGPAGRW
jgi:hypothetical protein